jgi:hypothetical protein
MLRAVLILEPILYSVGAMVYFCLRPPDIQPLWIDTLFAIYLVGLPIGLNLLHGDVPSDSGIRADNLKRAFVHTGVATALMASGLVTTSLIIDGFHWYGWGRFLEKIGMYVPWGLTQQYIVQAFAVVRLRHARLHPVAVVILASACFSIVHTPNIALMLLTFGAGLVWCSIFLQIPNLLALGLSHAVLATLTYFLLPESWMFRNRIGAQYIEKVWGG